MKIKKGIPVSDGVAIGEAFVLDVENYRISLQPINNDPQSIEKEKQRYLQAVEKAVEELKKIEKSTSHLRDIAIIFRGHRFIIEDTETQQEIQDSIEQNLYNSEYALAQIMWKHTQKLAAIQNEFYTRRLSDLEDVQNRLLRHLLGIRKESLASLKNPIVLVSYDLTPSQSALLPEDKVLGIVSATGGRTSHTAIVARTRGFPAVVGLANEVAEICNGDTIILDGTQGLVVVEPDEETLKKYRSVQESNLIRHDKLSKLKDYTAETKDGYVITLRSNIETPSEIKNALANGSDGIGLYRTEFIYVNNPNPTEEHHFDLYCKALQLLGNHKLTIRTLDFGADKNFGMDIPEPNPFLGCRSIRLCFERLPVFKTQLRAILRASVYGNVCVMFPMISSLEELLQVKSIWKEVKEDFDRKNIVYDKEIEIGIMVEIPSAALICDLLAREVDFLSIGTNDLIQYTLAVDRSNERVAHLYKPAHPAVFRLIQNVIDAGKKHQKKVSMCGEMSSELLYVVPLLGIGLREFSVSSGLIPEIKYLMRNITLRYAKQVAKKVLACNSHEEANNYLTAQLSKF